MISNSRRQTLRQYATSGRKDKQVALNAENFHYFTFMDFLLLKSFDNYISASMPLARLDEEGINCYLKDEYTVTIDPLLSNAIGGIKLMVAVEDFERASAFMAEYEKDYREAISCPQCGSHNIEFISKPGLKNWFTAITSWLFSSYALSAEQVYHCYDCGYETQNLPENEEPLTDQIVL